MGLRQLEGEEEEERSDEGGGQLNWEPVISFIPPPPRHSEFQGKIGNSSSTVLAAAPSEPKHTCLFYVLFLTCFPGTKHLDLRCQAGGAGTEERGWLLSFSRLMMSPPHLDTPTFLPWRKKISALLIKKRKKRWRRCRKSKRRTRNGRTLRINNHHSHHCHTHSKPSKLAGRGGGVAFLVPAHLRFGLAAWLRGPLEKCLCK